MTTKIDMLAHVIANILLLREQDPLLKLGIASDHVCVLRSDIEHHLIDIVKASPFYTDALPLSMQLHLATGRRTWVFPDVLYAAEYMSPDEFQKRYGDRITRITLDPPKTEEGGMEAPG